MRCLREYAVQTTRWTMCWKKRGRNNLLRVVVGRWRTVTVWRSRSVQRPVQMSHQVVWLFMCVVWILIYFIALFLTENFLVKILRYTGHRFLYRFQPVITWGFEFMAEDIWKIGRVNLYIYIFFWSFKNGIFFSPIQRLNLCVFVSLGKTSARVS